MDKDGVPKPQKFLLVGIVTSEDFQKCRYVLEKLHKSFPKEFVSPDVRPMLDVEWNQFITKVLLLKLVVFYYKQRVLISLKYRRRLGSGLWSIKNRMAVFRNGEFIGDFESFHKFIWSKWKHIFNQDWQCLTAKHLFEYLELKTQQCRHLAYLTIALDNHVIGSLLFELYSDIVPLACENFLNRCKSDVNGYQGTPIHRIVKNSWIQCGGYHLKPIKMPCENYVVPHDRRGVLSTCNNRPHNDNSTQFYIALDAAPWMDYKYVAFGQLLHGDEVLKIIEEVPTMYQTPLKKITIVKCGEYQMKFGEDEQLFTRAEIDNWKDIQPQVDILEYLKSYYQTMMVDEGQPDQYYLLPKEKFNDSILSSQNIKRGSKHLPRIADNEDEENYDIFGPDCPLMWYKGLYDSDTSEPTQSDVTL
ncbi:hypothetical protein ABEB36_008307 [Hypothenemus hampei]|uniref:PPIase cyclophilin-type domain-containing protein n=1 Tax=Hypothenemus hampei TaxID=57062 RepID=A0ABD1EPC9_HYPHA